MGLKLSPSSFQNVLDHLDEGVPPQDLWCCGSSKSFSMLKHGIAWARFGGDLEHGQVRESTGRKLKPLCSLCSLDSKTSFRSTEVMMSVIHGCQMTF